MIGGGDFPARLDVRWLRAKANGEAIALAAVVALAAALRFLTWPRLGFRGDEVWTLKWAARPVSEIMTSADIGLTMHLYVLFAKAWLRLGEVTPQHLKLPSLLAGVAAIPLTYLLAKRYAGGRAALISALLLAVSVQHIVFSRFGRVYALLLDVTLVSMALHLRVVERGRRRDWALLGLVNGLALMLSLNASMLILAQGLSGLFETLVVERSRGGPRRLGALLAAWGLAAPRLSSRPGR